MRCVIRMMSGKKKIISAVKCIENIDKPALYSSAVEVVDKDLTFIRKSFTDNTFKNPLYDILTYGTPGCTFVFNKALMEKLKQYKPSVISMHDSWISFVCLAVNGFFIQIRMPISCIDSMMQMFWEHKGIL